MTVSITIKQEFEYITNYYTGCDTDLGNFRIWVCERCSNMLNPIYVSIINDLKEAGLLPKGYKKLCCICYFLDKLGIWVEEFVKEGALISIRTSPEKDCAFIKITTDIKITTEDNRVIAFFIDGYKKLFNNNAPWLKYGD